jgi:hypothetical protein
MPTFPKMARRRKVGAISTLYEKSTVTVTRDIVPVASITKNFFVLLVNSSFPAKTVPEFIARSSGRLSPRGLDAPLIRSVSCA